MTAALAAVTWWSAPASAETPAAHRAAADDGVRASLVVAAPRAPLASAFASASAPATAAAAAAAREQASTQRPFGSHQLHKYADLGLPTHATWKNPDDLLMVRKGYVGSYSQAHLGPNWISYKVDCNTYGTDPSKWLPREPNFYDDPRLPTNVRRPTDGDYLNSGWDRGHEKRAGDAPLNHVAYKATFNFTNIVPQAHSVNAGPWLHFENYYRDVAMRDHKDVRVIIGNIFEGKARTIGADHVAVPSHLFKIIAISQSGTRVEDMSPKNTRMVAIVVPNDDKIDIGDNFAKYAVAPADIVRRTGWTGMLSEMPAATRRQLAEPKPVIERIHGAYKLNGEVIRDPEPFVPPSLGPDGTAPPATLAPVAGSPAPVPVAPAQAAPRAPVVTAVRTAP